jgi:hypothetical protein
MKESILVLQDEPETTTDSEKAQDHEPSQTTMITRGKRASTHEPTTSKNTTDWSEAEEDDEAAFTRSNITACTPCCAPPNVPMAPKKKESTLTTKPRSVNTTNITQSSTQIDETSSVDKSKLARTSKKATADQMNNVEPNLENILETMQAIHDALLQTILRSEQKTDARNKMAWAIESIKAMSGKLVDIPIPQRMPEESISHKEIMIELAEIKKAVKQTYTQTAQKAMTANPAPINHGMDHHHCFLSCLNICLFKCLLDFGEFCHNFFMTDALLRYPLRYGDVDEFSTHCLNTFNGPGHFVACIYLLFGSEYGLKQRIVDGLHYLKDIFQIGFHIIRLVGGSIL